MRWPSDRGSLRHRLRRCGEMGCGSSKADTSNLVILCRERTQLIRAARDRRYALAAAHAAYFRALAAVGDAFHRFVQEELVPEPASVPPPTSPVIVLPSPERKGKPGSASGNAADAASNSSSATPLSHSLSMESSDLPLSSGPGSVASPQDGSSKGIEAGIKGGSKGSEANRNGGSKGSDAGGKAGSSGGGGMGEDPPSRPQLFSPYSPNSSFMGSSTAIPVIVYQDTLAQPWPSSYYGGYIYPPYDDPIGSPSQERQDMIGPSTPAVAPGTPPPPPPDTSSWDFFNPFNTYEEFLPDYSGGIYGSGFFISSPDLNDVRKQEGIPELEVDVDVELMRKVKKEKKITDAKLGGKDPTIRSSSRVSTREIREKDKKVGGIALAEKESKSSSAHEITDAKLGGKDPLSRVSTREIREKDKKVGGIALAEKESKSSSAHESSSSSAGSKVRSSGEDEISNGKKKGVTFEELSSYATEESLPSTEKPVSADVARRGGQQLLVQGTRDVMEVVQEIKENFKSAAACGEDLSRILEVGKVPYRSRSRMFRVFSSRILDHMALPLLIKSYPSLSQYLTKNKRTASNTCVENHTTTRSGNLSLILEKLYVWEKKLYKEVKDEEKLRIKYDKKYRLLRTLDDRGAESSKIDLAWASVGNLRTEISIIVKSVDAISSRMHKIRDEELQPQLTELIQGSIKMWKTLLYCHQKQLQTLLDCKSHRLVMKTTSQKRDASKATKKLELELLNWCNCFNNWISVLKSYILALNGWLMKWLPQEQEQTPDGIAPFSPTKIGAPTTFICSNDWHHAVNSISVEKVFVRMHAFTETIHILWESQDEEQRQRLKQQRLLSAYNRRSQIILDSRKDGDLSGHDGSQQRHDDLMAVDTLRKELDEKRLIHVETLRRLQDAASSLLPTGLIPIFEELESFTSEALRVYNGIRTSSDSGGT